MSNYLLFFIGFLGVVVHTLIKLREHKMGIKEYLSSESINIIISTIVVLVALLCKTEIAELQQVSNYLGLSFFTIGYCAQSVLVAFIGRINKFKQDE